MSNTAKQWAIYLITCTVTGQAYIGQTSKRVASRWSAHVSHAAAGTTYPLLQAIREYGEAAFTIETILCCKSKTDADWAERHLVHERGTLAPEGYNLIAGVGMPGRVVSAKGRAKNSASKRELWRDPAYRARNVENSHRALVIARERLQSALADPEKRARINRARAPNAMKHRTIRDHRQGNML